MYIYIKKLLAPILILPKNNWVKNRKSHNLDSRKFSMKTFKYFESLLKRLLGNSAYLWARSVLYL